jgi:hypothetical protein
VVSQNTWVSASDSQWKGTITNLKDGGFCTISEEMRGLWKEEARIEENEGCRVVLGWIASQINPGSGRFNNFFKE